MKGSAFLVSQLVLCTHGSTVVVFIHSNHHFVLFLANGACVEYWLYYVRIASLCSCTKCVTVVSTTRTNPNTGIEQYLTIALCL